MLHPSGGCRFARIVEVRLAPDRFHHVLGQILRRDRSNAKPDQLRLHARPKVIEEDRERPPVAACAHRDQEIVELICPRPQALSGVAGIVGPARQVHGTLPSQCRAAGCVARMQNRMQAKAPRAPATLGSIRASPVAGCAGCHVLPADRPGAGGRPALWAAFSVLNSFPTHRKWVKLEGLGFKRSP
jgi:hypothetical protein